ncbi:MAG: methionyl-tRNA formyltransferase [Syntrophobacterales bacterium]|jgi:methionyl-tRNA formyltransferase|nr:methionyl-tRNA formyltransferase [Syntrophobacterales bacterium]
MIKRAGRMNMGQMSILFMGTPDFAIPSLQILLHHGLSIVGVVTQPDRPKGRGRRLVPPPVKVIAEAHNLPVFQPGKIREESFLQIFRELAPDLVVVVAFGQILPREMLIQPRYGCINVHPSLLPQYRGPAPIQWSLIRGEKVTGVTIMRLDEGIDSGDILLQETVAIDEEETFASLHDRLAETGAKMLYQTIGMLGDQSIRPIPQDHTKATPAPRLNKEDGLINWHMNVPEILALIRGLSPEPGAYTYIDGKKLKIFAASGTLLSPADPPGTIHIPGKGTLTVTAGNGIISLLDVQGENKNRMSIQNFLQGYRMKKESDAG